MPLALGAFAILTTLVATPAVGAPEHPEQLVSGKSMGNHDMDCLVIRPWLVHRPWGDGGPGEFAYPVIGRVNGWDQGNILGQTTTQGYKPGQIKWATRGLFIAIAANQWSARESDLA